MDIKLERILLLIPKNKDGSFKHGEQAKFAKSIGLRSGNVISDWINGRSKSYSKYLYEIAAKYGVSVEWLEGKTDGKELIQECERTANEGGLTMEFNVVAMSAADAAEIMRKAGIHTSADKVRAGIKQGVYPFGTYIENDEGGCRGCDVFLNQLEAWLAERSY